MSRLLSRLATFAFVRRRLVLPGTLVAIVAVLFLAAAGGGSFSDGGSIPGSPAQNTLDSMDKHFAEPDRASADIVFSASAGHRIDEPRYAAAIATALDQAGGVPGVADVSKAMTSENGRTSVADVAFDATEADGATTKTLDALKLTGIPASGTGMQVIFGGDSYDEEAAPVGPIEGIGMLVALAVLAITFGSLLAAGLPMLTALLGVVLSIGAMAAASAVVDVDASAITLAMMVGLSVGIDYALLIISRHRTQLTAGVPVQESVRRAMTSAGSSVVFAGATVIIALAGLSVVRLPVLTGMGLSAAGAVAIAVLLALVLVPALLGFAGTRMTPALGSRTARRLARATGDRPTVFGARWARIVTARPRLTVLATLALLITMSVPALSLKTSLSDAGTSAESSPARQAYDVVSRDFGPGAHGPLVALAEGGSAGPKAEAAAKKLAALPGVASVSPVDVAEDGRAARVLLTPTTGPTDSVTKDLVERLQAKAPPGVAITGKTAVDIDISNRLTGALVPFAMVVVGLSLLLLLVAFRSIAIPVKAAAGFLLSVGASFGATVAVFQWGWLAGPLGIPNEGPIASFMPIITMAVLFGLAMDYQVFVVSAIKEQYARTRNARASIVTGAAHASRVVTAAALIMVAVFGSFVTSPEATMKPIAFSLAIGVLIDAFVVRMTLVPAVLALLGDRAWWLPRWLGRLLPQVDLEGGDEQSLAPVPRQEIHA